MDQFKIEADAVEYSKMASVIVPFREQQLATLISLIPYSEDENFCVVELGCGEGQLAKSLANPFSPM
jgi:hypothetical protein